MLTYNICCVLDDISICAKLNKICRIDNYELTKERHLIGVGFETTKYRYEHNLIKHYMNYMAAIAENNDLYTFKWLYLRTHKLHEYVLVASLCTDVRLLQWLYDRGEKFQDWSIYNAAVARNYNAMIWLRNVCNLQCNVDCMVHTMYYQDFKLTKFLADEFNLKPNEWVFLLACEFETFKWLEEVYPEFDVNVVLEYAIRGCPKTLMHYYKPEYRQKITEGFRRSAFESSFEYMDHVDLILKNEYFGYYIKQCLLWIYVVYCNIVWR